jgi:hypothetical protein
MITITQPKVQGFWPRWAPFNGFSLLFDTISLYGFTDMITFFKGY